MNQINWSAYAKVELSTYFLNNFIIDTEKVITDIATNIEKTTIHLQMDETTKKRHNFFNILGAKSNDYREKIIELDNRAQAIVGIRFFGLDNNKPFLSVKTNFQINNSKEQQELFKNLAEYFSVFSPKQIQVFSPIPPTSSAITQILMMGNTSNVPKLETDIFLKQVKKNEDYYSWYSQQYDLFHKNRPDLKEIVTMNSKDLMDESKENGLLYIAYKKSEKIGLIAGEKADFLGKKCLYINDILVGNDFKKQGYGKIIQNNFIHIMKNQCELIFGTIHPQNIPSLKTSISNGRIPVRYESMVDI